MPQIINTNINSLTAQRNLNSSQADGNQALTRLSSGLRINSASDDAAGLAISNRFESQISGLNVATRNAGDGVSLSQTAEGSLSSMADSLGRLRELAVQSANATNSDVDRQALNEEAQQIIEEVDQLSQQANFNGVKLLDGSFQNQQFQTGANVGETINVSIGEASIDTLGVAATSGVSTISSSATARTASMAAGDLVINGAAIGAADASADGASTASQALSAISIASSVNKASDSSGVTATVNENSAGGTQVANVAAAGVVIGINNVAITVSGSGVDGNLAADLQGVADQINLFSGQSGVTAAVDPSNLAAGVTLTAADGRNIALTGAASATAGLAAADTYTGSVTLVSKDGSDIDITSNTGNSLENAGIEIGTYSGSQAIATSDKLPGGAGPIATGDLVINGVAVGETYNSYDNASTANKSTSAISVAAAVNLVSDRSGVTAEANNTQVTSGNLTANTGGNATINGVAIEIAAGTTGTSSEQVGLAVDAINAKSAQTGVVAQVVDDNQYELIAADGRNIDITAVGGTSGLSVGTTSGTVKLVSGGPVELSTQTGNIANTGFEVGTFGGSEDGQLLKDVDISTVEGANSAITAVDNALGQISSQQAELGAIQNRFTNTQASNSLNSENLSAANSRIKDADFAAETAALSRASVLQQAGISVLAQANAQPQQVLSLLG